MAKKYKLTGCARFLIFLLIVAPLVYVGVSYAQGQNPFELLQKTWNNVTEKVQTSTKQSDDVKPAEDVDVKSSPSSDVGEISILNGTIKAQKKRIDDQNEYIESLEYQIEELNKQIKKIKSQE